MSSFDPGHPLPVFGGIPTYCRATLTEPGRIEPGYVAVAGVTWDHTSPGTIGARFGPKAIREGSIYLGYHLQAAKALATGLLEVSTLEPLRLSADSRLVDCGDLRIYPADTARTVEAIAEQASLVVRRGATPVFLGGDRFVAYPLWRGVAAASPEPIGFLQVAADLCLAAEADPLWGRLWRGATNRRILESRAPAPAGMAWLGTSGFVAAPDWDYARAQGLTVVTARQARAEGLGPAARRALDAARGGASRVYVSIDIGVVDGVFAPGTEQPHVGGLSNVEFLELMDALADAPLAGLDVVGVVPNVELPITTARLAAVALLRILAKRVSA
jgi:arginase family enzyme